MKPFTRIVAITTLLSVAEISCACAQATPKSIDKLKHDRVYTFLLKDGSCKFGELATSDKKSITIRNGSQTDAIVPISELLQFGQGSDLFFDARSSWLDVKSARLYARESMLVTLTNGTLIHGKPKAVSANTLTIQQAWSAKTIRKEDIGNIVVLKLRPATASFEFVQEEAGFFQIFYPEFYQRAFRSEGRVPVRLYDSSIPEDDSEGIPRCNPRHIPGYVP